MNIETIKWMINDSTWRDSENWTLYKFTNGKDLSINGKTHLNYAIKTDEGKIMMLMGAEKQYTVEYVNDFVLRLCNQTEQLKLIPE